MRLSFVPMIAIILIAVSAGCVSQQREIRDGLAIKLTADPDDIHYTEATTLYVDMENKGKTDFKRIDFSLFDTGILTPLDTGCRGSAEGIKPGQIVTSECGLAWRQDIPLVSQVTATTLKFKAITQNNLKSTAVLQMLSQEEWRRRVTAGNLKLSGNSFSAEDNNLAIDADFTKTMPFAASAAGEKVLFTVKISDIGNGFIEKLEPDQFKIEQSGNLIKCDFTRPIMAFGKRFPPIFCELDVDTGGQAYSNYAMTISVDYDYEVRSSVEVTLRR